MIITGNTYVWYKAQQFIGGGGGGGGGVIILK